MTVDRHTVGVVTPHAATGPEVEIPAMTGGRVTTVTYRTRSSPAGPTGTASTAHADLRTSTEPATLERAAPTFRDSILTAVAHASTTSGYVVGRSEEAAMVERLSQRFDVPAVASCAAAAAALQAHGATRLQLVHPPWFDEEFDGLGVAYFRGLGFDAVATRAVGLPDDPSRVERRGVITWVEQHVENETDAVFLAGNGFRAAGTVEELERRTGRLVVAANQALLWGILAATGTEWDITGYGRLLAGQPCGGQKGR